MEASDPSGSGYPHLVARSRSGVKDSESDAHHRDNGAMGERMDEVISERKLESMQLWWRGVLEMHRVVWSYGRWRLDAEVLQGSL